MAKDRKLTKQQMAAYKKAGRGRTLSKDTMESFKKAAALKKWAKVPKSELAKKVGAKRTVGKVLGRAIPGAAAVLTAAEIVKMVKNRKAKPIKGKSCGPGKTKVTTGGKTYCVSGKKKFKAGKPARDPISKR